MSISSLILDYEDFLVLRGEIIDKILLSSNPDAALLYLYISRAKKSFNPSKAMKHLGFTKERYDKTVYDLMCMQVLESKKEEKKQSIHYEEKPKYTTSALRAAREDVRFSAVCDTAESVLGKVLTDSYIKTLLYIYDRLKLPAEVIVELLVYLKDNKSEPPRRSDIEREARLWIDMGIATYTDATNYIASKYAEKPLFESMMQALKIYGRDPQPIEERYILSFINYGFTSDVVSLAVEKMFSSLGKFSFQYLNKILLSFKEQNLFTVDDILQKDPNFKGFAKEGLENSTVAELADWEIEMMKELQKEWFFETLIQSTFNMWAK